MYVYVHIHTHTLVYAHIIEVKGQEKSMLDEYFKFYVNKIL